MCSILKSIPHRSPKIIINLGATFSGPLFSAFWDPLGAFWVYIDHVLGALCGCFFERLFEVTWDDLWNTWCDLLRVLTSFASLASSPETWSRPRRKARAKTTGLDRTFLGCSRHACTHLCLSCFVPSGCYVWYSVWEHASATFPP